VNNYQYAPNPVGWIDPLGLCKDKDEKRDIVYFSKDDIKHNVYYGGAQYQFYVDNNGPLDLASTTIDVDEEELQFYISNIFNYGILMKGEGLSITDEILSQSIDIYTDTYGKPPEFLNGSIIKSNLSNYQKEYSSIKYSDPAISDEDASNEAIRKISFGRSRVELGYDDISVNNELFGDVIVDKKQLYNVPTKVFIKARRNKSPNEDKS